MTHPEALKTLTDQLLLTVFYAIDTLCVVHIAHVDETWDLYDAKRSEIRKELLARRLQPEGYGFVPLWVLARKDLPR